MKQSIIPIIRIPAEKILALLFVLCLTSAVHAQSSTVTISVKDMPLSSFFLQLEKMTNYTFLYKNEILEGKPNLTISASNQPLSKVLGNALINTGLTWVVDDNVIILKKASGSQTQNLPVKRIQPGKVTDENGEPLMGCTIIEKDSKKPGVVTDADGNFLIELTKGEDATLVISYIGMKTLDIPVRGSANLQVVLSENSVMLNELVVLGYGMAQKKTDLVGSAYQVDAKKIEALPANRIDNLLDGMVPGLQIEFNTDLASSTTPRLNTRVRGESSMSASKEPIWIVDGVRIYTGDNTNMITGMSTSVSPLSYLSSEDIESMTVLKDASSTSLYGADGANGVILVTTKKGKLGKNTLSFSARHGISNINKSTKFKVLNADQYMTLAKEAWVNAGKDLQTFPYQDNAMNSYSTTNTDWTDVFYGPGFTDEFSLTFSGGNENAKYYIAGNYFEDQSTIKGNRQKRYSVRSNTDLKINKNITFTLNTFSSYNINKLFNPGDDYYQNLPIYSVYNPDGSFQLYNTVYKYESGVGSWVKQKFFNSVAEREENDYRQRTFANNSTGILKVRLTDYLFFSSQFGVDFQSSYEDIYNASTNLSGYSSSDDSKGNSSRNNANFLQWTAVQRLNFNKDFGKHRVGGVAAFEATSKDAFSVGGSASGFVNDHIKEISYASGEEYASSSSSTTRTLSMLGQINYSYDDRYFLVLNLRRDGSSDFGTDVQWGNFASVGTSWNMHNEAFYDWDKINIFKWKLSYGTNGNSRLGSQQSMGLYTFSESNSYMGSGGGTISDIPNPKLSWEETHILNGGLRLRLFDRIDLDMEAYNKTTYKMLSDLDVSRLTGSTRGVRNMGTMRNRGIEATLGIDILQKKDWNWNFEVNASHNKNKILKLYNHISKVMGNKIWAEGEDINTFYLIRWAGVDPLDGAPLWLDANGNVTRTYDTNNRVAYKSSSPDVFGGFTNTISYKSWTLSAVASYVIGGYSFSNFSRRTSSDGGYILDENQSINQLDRWQKPGDITNTPKLIYGNSTKSTMNSTRYLYSTTRLLLRNVSVSYILPKAWIRPAGFSAVRLSLTGDNLGLWTPYDSKNRNSYKQCISGYPMETTWTMGVNCSF
jgi:TonB-linked SusC/RagA family outer membrane protein